MNISVAELGLTTRRFTIEVTAHAGLLEGRGYDAVADELLDWLTNVGETETDLPWVFSFDGVDPVTP